MRTRLDAENPFIKLGLCHVNFHRTLPLHRTSKNHDALFGARNSSLDEEQILFSADVYDFQILDRDILIAPMARHFLTLADSPRIRPVTNRPPVSKIFMSAMRSWKPGK